jgi:hypothetical protein
MPTPAAPPVAPRWNYNDRPANTPYIIQRVSRLGNGFAYDVWCSDTHTEKTITEAAILARQDARK